MSEERMLLSDDDFVENLTNSQCNFLAELQDKYFAAGHGKGERFVQMECWKAAVAELREILAGRMPSAPPAPVVTI